jgi:hypothetical protein
MNIRFRIVFSIALIAGIFFVRFLYLIIRVIIKFDENFENDSWKSDDIGYGIYYSFYLLIFDFIPKIYLMYNAVITKDRMLRFDSHLSSQSYDSSVVAFSKTESDQYLLFK